MHPLVRTVAGITAVAALGGAFAAGVAVGSSPADPRDKAADLRLVNADLRPVSSCADLLAWYVDHGVDRVSAYGWGFPMVYAMEDSAATTPQPADVTNSATGTNVQEAGVDEPDVVKTDGSLLVRVEDDRVLAVYDVRGAGPVRLGELALTDIFEPELLLAGDRVVVIGRDPATAKPGTGPGTRVLVVDLADPASPTVVSRTAYDSSLVTARQHGDVVRLVLSANLPDLDFVEPGMLRRESTALERNQAVVRASTIDDWLPHVTTEGPDVASREQLVDCRDVAVPAEDAGLGTVAVVGFDVADPAAAGATAVTTPSQTVYVSAEHLYLASSPYRYGWGVCCWDVVPQPGPVTLEDEGTTYLYDFALAGTSATYAASGRVEGAVADRWAMDEHDGVLRVAVGPTTKTGDFSSVVTFGRDGSHLVESGRVGHLGVGEDIKAVRWYDDLAVVVTFRQTDPFYAVDLSDPASPRLLGELRIPGFSSYLHPIGGGLVVGLGSSASAVTGAVRGAKASLFDIADPSAPRELDTVEYPEGTSAQAAVDPRQFTWLPDRRTALTVIASAGWESRTGYVSVLRVADATISSSLVEVEYGDEVDDVRLVPLPDNRVVLSTGDGVSFFPLGT